MSRIEIDTSDMNLQQKIALLHIRDKHKCQYAELTSKSNVGACSHGALHTHHILPVKKGGSDDLDNIVLLCRRHHIEIHNEKKIRNQPSLFEFLIKHDITQTSLGGALGISQSAISQIISNGSCNLKTAKKIRNYLRLVTNKELTIDEIFGI